MVASIVLLKFVLMREKAACSLTEPMIISVFFEANLFLVLISKALSRISTIHQCTRIHIKKNNEIHRIGEASFVYRI